MNTKLEVFIIKSNKIGKTKSKKQVKQNPKKGTGATEEHFENEVVETSMQTNWMPFS